MSVCIYIHIPFCIKKCSYCDFASQVVKTAPQDDYTKCVIKEIEHITREVYAKKVKCKSVYFGGGTPSLFSPDNIHKIISQVQRSYDLDDDAEITLEANPKSADFKKLKGFKAAGVNRLSIGVQSFNDALLRTLGRVHSSQDAVDFFNLARRAGFDNISVDIMFGVSGQSKTMLTYDLAVSTGLAPEHISAYILTLEDKTPMKELVRTGKLKPLNDDIIADMFNTIEGYLSKNAYKHYEISNYAKDGKESAHNLNYWRYGEYLGFGAAAHSMLKGDNAARFLRKRGTDDDIKALRWNNPSDYKEYLKRVNTDGEAFDGLEFINEKRRLSEYLMMGLRLSEGIKLADFKKEFGGLSFDTDDEKFKLLADNGLIEIKNNTLKLTEKGVLLSDEVLVRLI